MFNYLSNYFFSEQLLQETGANEILFEEFFNFLLNFYENEFLEDIFILHQAAKYSPAIIVKRLLECNQNIESKNESGLNPFAIAIINDNIPVAQVLFSKDININFEIHHTSCFLYYLQNSTCLSLVSLFVRHLESLDVQHTDMVDNTILHIICENVYRNNFIESVRIFIDKGVKTDAKNLQGWFFKI